MIEFFGYFRSSAAYRCRIAFNLKGIDYDFKSIHLRRGGGEQKSASYRALNPQALVPTLKVGDLKLGQSLAIIEWLDETYPEPYLLPRDIDLRARVRAFSQIIACDIHPLQNLRVLQHIEAEYGVDQSGKNEWCARWIGDGLTACEALIAEQPTNAKFCFGDEPGLADICLVPQVFSAHRFQVDVSKMPNLIRIYEACQSLPAFLDAAPNQQPDAEP